jgi:hypothetical protein
VIEEGIEDLRDVESQVSAEGSSEEGRRNRESQKIEEIRGD